MTEVFGVEQSLDEYDLLLVVLARLLQLSRQVNDVLTHCLAFFVIHAAVPSKQSAPHQLGHHVF